MGEETDPEGVEWEWVEDIETAVDREVALQGPTTTDVVFDLLSNRHRRFVLYSLCQRDGAIDVPQLTDAVVRLAESSRTSSPTGDSVAARLRHTTLPRLADAGVVVYDRTAEVVWPTEAVYAMKPLLDFAAEADFESGPPMAEYCVE